MSYDSVYTGFWYDFDIPSTDYLNDSAGYIQQGNICYMSDAGGYSQKIGICFLQPSGTQGANWFNYTNLPEDDNAYFSALQNVNVSPSWPSVPADYKIMINCAPNPLGAGETLTIVYGVVAGYVESELTVAATRMSYLYDSLTLFVQEQPVTVTPNNHLYLPGRFFSGVFSAVLYTSCDEPVTVRVFDVQGRTVLDFGIIQAQKGQNTISVDANSLPVGQYFLKVASPSFEATEKFSKIE